MKTTILQLEAHDDVISTRDKMTWSKTPRILLVWPRRGKILQRKVDLVLLQRQGRALGAQIALVTRDHRVLPFAREVGIPVFSSTRQAQRRPWGPSAPPVSVARAERAALGRDALEAQRESLRPRIRSIWQSAPARALAFLLAILSVAGLALFFLPTGEVVFTPERVKQELALPLRAALDVPAASATGDIPARRVQVVVEGSRDAPTTGMTSAADTFARGSVRLTNLTADPVLADAGMQVRTLDEPPLRFALEEATQVPAGVGQSVDARVRALQAGSQSNVPPGSILVIEDALGLDLKVTNPEPLLGGTDRLARTPSSMDVDQLREALLEDLRQQAVVDLNANLVDGQELLPESLRVAAVLDEERRPEIGQAGDILTIQMRVEFTALAIDSADVEQVARAGLDANLPAGFRVVEGSFAFQPAAAPVLDDGGESMRWQVRASRALEADWSQEGVVQGVLGRNRQEAAAELRRVIVLQSEPEIRIWPEWWKWLPYLPFRITVEAQ